MRYYLAVDIGASSGRHIVGHFENGKMVSDEVYRFPNSTKLQNGHLIWDISAILGEIKTGISVAKERFGDILSLSIDTWGVDYVLLKGDREVLPCYAYRDDRTSEAIEQVHKLIPFLELYRRTGCQFQPFTTVYQLYDDKLRGRFNGVTDMLMMPEYFMYKLTGVKAWEYTQATTTGLLGAQSGEFDYAITDLLGLPRQLFPKVQKPGTVIGEYDGIKVVLCATHDTASAVEGIPMDGVAPYISSGTWSLLGVKTDKPITDAESERANYSNEGGVGYNRYQKNIMGMWLINELRMELCPDMPIGEIVKLAENSSCETVLDANAPEFLSPKSMKQAFDKASGGALKTAGDYFRCAYMSLASSYKTALDRLEENTHQKYDRLYIVGGGAKNAFLNALTEEYTSKKVIALPIEATALGNLKIQAEAIK